MIVIERVEISNETIKIEETHNKHKVLQPAEYKHHRNF